MSILDNLQADLEAELNKQIELNKETQAQLYEVINALKSVKSLLDDVRIHELKKSDLLAIHRALTVAEEYTFKYRTFYRNFRKAE